MAQENFRDRFRANRGGKKCSESSSKPPNKISSSSAQSARRSILNSNPTAKQVSASLPKRSLYLAGLGTLLAMCLLTLVLWDSFFGHKVPVFASPPRYQTSTADLIGDTPVSDSALVRLKTSGHIKQAKTPERNIVDAVIDAIVPDPQKTWKTDLKGGGASQKLWVFYVNNHFLLDPKGRVLLVGSEGNDPFKPLTVSNKSTIELQIFLENLASGIKDGGLAIVGLDLRPTNAVNNFAYLKFPVEAIEKAFDGLNENLKKKLLVILPCKNNQRSWLSAKYQRSFFGAHFLDGIATGFGKNASLDSFTQELTIRVADDVLRKLGTFAQQNPHVLVGDKVDLKKYSLFGWYGATAKSRLPTEPTDYKDERLNQLWEYFGEKYKHEDLWRLNWKDLAEKTRIEDELALLEALYDYGSISSYREEKTEKLAARLKVDSKQTSALKDDVQNILMTGNSEEDIDNAWSKLNALVIPNLSEKINAENSRDEALRICIRVLCFELNDSTGAPQVYTSHEKDKVWKAAKSILGNYLAIQSLCYDTNPGFFNGVQVDVLRKLTHSFMHSVDCAVSHDFEEAIEKGIAVDKDCKQLKKVRDSYHTWINNTRHLSSMTPTFLSFLIDSAANDYKLASELAANLKHAEELRTQWVNLKSEQELNKQIEKVEVFDANFKAVQKTIIKKLQSFQGKSSVGEDAIKIRATLRCPDLPRETRKAYHEKLKSFWSESTSNSSSNIVGDLSEQIQSDGDFSKTFNELRDQFLSQLSEGQATAFEPIFHHDIRFAPKSANAVERLWQLFAIGDYGFPSENEKDSLFDKQDKEEATAYRKWQFERYCLERWGDPRNEKSGVWPFKQLAESFAFDREDVLKDNKALQDATASLVFGYDPQTGKVDYKPDLWSEAGDRFALIIGEERRAVKVTADGNEIIKPYENRGASESVVMAIRGHRRAAELDSTYDLSPPLPAPRAASITVRSKPVSTSIAILLDCSKSMGIEKTGDEGGEKLTNFDDAKGVVKNLLGTIATLAENQEKSWEVSFMPFGYKPDELSKDLPTGLLKADYSLPATPTVKTTLSTTWRTEFRDFSVSTNVDATASLLPMLKTEYLYDTPLYIAIQSAVGYLKPRNSERKIVLVISDGADRPRNSTETIELEKLSANLNESKEILQLLFYQLKMDPKELEKFWVELGESKEDAEKLAEIDRENNSAFMKKIGGNTVGDFASMNDAILSKLQPQYRLYSNEEMIVNTGSQEALFRFNNRVDLASSLQTHSQAASKTVIELAHDQEGNTDGGKVKSEPIDIYPGQDLTVNVSQKLPKLECSFPKKVARSSKGTELTRNTKLNQQAIYYEKLSSQEKHYLRFIMDEANMKDADELTKPIVRPKHFVGIYELGNRTYFFTDPIYEDGHFLPTIQFAPFGKQEQGNANSAAQPKLSIYAWWDDYKEVQWVDPKDPAVLNILSKQFENLEIRFPKLNDDSPSKVVVEIDYKEISSAELKQRLFVLVEYSDTKILERRYFEKPENQGSKKRQFHRERHEFELPPGGKLGFVQAKDLLSESAKANGLVKRWSNETKKP